MKNIYFLIILNIVFFLLNLYSGSVSIPMSDVTNILLGDDSVNKAWSFIILQSRFPAAITAMLTGSALGVCGLLLQSYFRNPLAGPSILGITSGANLAVAVSLLSFGITSGLTLTLSAVIGSFVILAILLLLSEIVRDSTTLLIAGILISYLTNAIITLLNYYSSADGIQTLLIWGMGNFNGVGVSGLLSYCILILIGLSLSIFLIKPLNGWMLGEQYATNLGINIGHTRLLTLFVTGILAAVTTAYCGPISFIGLSIPHIARMITRTDNHRSLIPYTALLGALCTSLCLFISSLPADGRLLPINALTSIFGVPVIIYVLLCKK